MNDPSVDSAEAKYRRQRVAVVAIGAALLAFGCVVLLVLTGIIAEPETLLENAIRAFSGGG